MDLVILESPFAGDVERNIKYARMCMRDCLLRGEAPFASHLLYTQPGVLDDDIPEERNLGIEAGFFWGEKADKTVVYTDLGISKGMQQGIDRARLKGRPVEMRTLSRWSVEERVRAVVATFVSEGYPFGAKPVEPHEIDDDFELYESGYDSLDQADLMMRLKHEFDLDIPDDDKYLKITTISEAVDAIEELTCSGVHVVNRSWKELTQERVDELVKEGHELAQDFDKKSAPMRQFAEEELSKKCR